MKIGLIDVDCHAKKKKWGATIYPNLALCKISAWHKSQGDEVIWFDPMYTGHCDKVYVSKVFNFSPDIDFFIDADEAGICSEERSMISPDYARNFICDFIIGKEQIGTQLNLF